MAKTAGYESRRKKADKKIVCPIFSKSTVPFLSPGSFPLLISPLGLLLSGSCISGSSGYNVGSLTYYSAGGASPLTSAPTSVGKYRVEITLNDELNGKYVSFPPLANEQLPTYAPFIFALTLYIPALLLAQ